MLNSNGCEALVVCCAAGLRLRLRNEELDRLSLEPEQPECSRDRNGEELEAVADAP